ncbi:MAG TPA: hypothetical protein VEQ38_12085 [Verrucomicrobiae bacterium]|nr:hypothetical protein [Verrucomicrobiae bacterium]
MIHAIVWYASKREEKLTTLRLVKFLYLADLYHARVSKGETLTGWPWAFVYFGPWCQQAKEAIDNAAQKDLVIVKEIPSKYNDEKDYRLFWVDEIDDEPKIIDALPTYVWSKLQWAIQKWADDSSGLLDYVYFETEPMLETKPGALLDFGRSQMPVVSKRIEMKKIPKAKLDEAKKTIARLQEKYKKGISSRPSQGATDAVYQEFVSQLEEEDLETGLEGTAELEDLDSGRKS